MKTTNIIIVIIVVIAVAVSYYFFVGNSQNSIDVGMPVPGNDVDDMVVEKITYNNASSDLIVVDLPFPGAVTGKQFSVIGKARGTWFFEASFPIEVLDKDGKSLGVFVAQAQSEWMTEDFVPFKAEVKVSDSYIGPATLVLKKDNPSDIREYDASISFPFTIEY